jgi:DNA-binding winged helix-turn-helix (wHTH) protein
MEVLLYLALKPGEVVRRQLLIDEVWRTVVNDEVLSRAISLLRSHLGDDPKSPRYILTVPKIGYRLILEPIVVLKPSSSPGRPDAVESPESSLPARTRLLLRHATGIWR